MRRKAIILVSGGLDSATTLALAKSMGYDCYALSFDYDQRHQAELKAAGAVCRALKVPQHLIYKLDLRVFGGSALTDERLCVPTGETSGIPITYVPARNTIFLSIALAWAEVLPALDIFMGVNVVDYSGYPDCRPDFIAAFQTVAQLATKMGAEGRGEFKIHTPLIAMTKREIIQTGLRLGVDYSLTVSCYQANQKGEACGMCDSCRIRKQGFLGQKIPDPTRYSMATCLVDLPK